MIQPDVLEFYQDLILTFVTEFDLDLSSCGRFERLSSRLKSAYQKMIYLFLNQNTCCGCSKEPSQWDGYFEHPKHVKTDG